MADTSLRKVARNSVIFTVAEFLNRGIGFLLIPIYGQFLAPAEYGLLSVAAAVGNILTILYLQPFESFFVRYYFEEESLESRRRMFGSTWVFLIGYTVVASLLIEGVGRAAGGIGLRSIPYDPYLRVVVWMTVIRNATLLLPRAIFLAREEPWKYAATNLAQFTVTTGLIVWFVAVQDEGALGSLHGQFIAAAAVGVPALLAVRRHFGLAFEFRYVREALAYVGPLLPHMLSLWALNISDRIILEQYVSLDDLGVYTLGYQIASIVDIVALSGSTAVSPFYYRTASGGPEALRTLSRVGSLYVLALGWTGLAVVGFGEHIIDLVARPSYQRAAAVVPWVAAGFFARGFYFVFVTALYYSKDLKWLPLVTVLAGALNIALNVVFVPRFGFMAAAVNTAVAYVAQSLLLFPLAQKAFPLPYEYRRVAVLLTLLISAAALLLGLDMDRQMYDLLFSAVITAAFPLVLVSLNWFNRDELRMVGSWLGRWIGK